MARFLSVLLAPRVMKEAKLAYPLYKLERLAKWAYRFSPMVSPDMTCETSDPRHNGINLDVTGCERLFKGEQNLLEKIRTALLDLGLRSRISIAPTLGAAWALSRYGPDKFSIVKKDTLKNSLSLLSIKALRISTKTEQALFEIGIRRIGDLLSIPRSALNERFDSDLIKRLDQVLGIKKELITPLRFSAPLRGERIFDSFVKDREILKHTSSLLLEELISVLKKNDTKASQILLELRPKDSPPILKYLTLSIPSSNTGHLWSLLEKNLETLHLEQGIESLSLTITQTEALSYLETNYIEDSTSKDRTKRLFGEMLDSLSVHLGPSGILKLKSFESHLPEKSFAYIPSSLPSSKKAPSPLVHAQRPSILFSIPKPIAAISMLPDKPPVRLLWKKTSYNVITGLGPERISPPWWGRDDELCKTRDYFRVQLDSGSWLWVFRELETSKWFIHGIWA